MSNYLIFVFHQIIPFSKLDNLTNAVHKILLCLYKYSQRDGTTKWNES